MAIIKDVIYCLNTKNEKNDGNSNANGILASISPEYIPGSFSFSVVIILLNFQNKPCNVKAKFCGPDGEDLVVTDMITLQPQDNPYNIPDEYMGINLSIDWQNVVFRHEGLYRTVIEIDGQEYDYPIYAKGRN